jgi:hypothetical protein
MTRRTNLSDVRGLLRPDQVLPREPEPSGETMEQREEVCAAWHALPDELRKDPRLTRLYHALGGPRMDDPTEAEAGVPVIPELDMNGEPFADGVKEPPALPTTDELEDLWQTTHYGHPADFAADVLERWGGWMPGLLGHGGALQEAIKIQAQRNASVDACRWPDCGCHAPQGPGECRRTAGVTPPAKPLWQQHEERIKQLMEQAGFPNSMALYQAFKQFAQELTAGVVPTGGDDA